MAMSGSYASVAAALRVPFVEARAGLSIEHECWSLDARLRNLRPRPLIKDNSQRSGPSFLVNLRPGYRVAKNVHVFAEVLNVLNRKEDNIDYYTSLLKGETSPVDASGQPTGANDHVIHQAEPRELRVSAAVNF